MVKKYKAPLTFTRYALIGATGHVVGLGEADKLPEGTTHICRPGEQEWTKLAPDPRGK